MLRRVRWQDWSGNFAYAPPVRDGVLNDAEIVSVTPCESRGPGPWVKVSLRNGEQMICQGKPDDFTDKGGEQ